MERNSQKFRHGTALIIVIAALVILILIAIPFSISMRVEKQITGSELLRIKAQLAAKGMMNYAMAKLSQSCEYRERFSPQHILYKTPDYDSPEELVIKPQLPGIALSNPRGQIWSALVEDEQGKININSATPWLLGNIIGSAIITVPVTADDTVIEVDNISSFSKDGGYLWANGELIAYGSIAGKCFVRCKRGLYRQSPRFLPPQNLTTGMLLIDARAYRIVSHRLLVRPSHYTPYRTVEEIRSIADLGIYAIDADLFAKIAPLLTVHSGRNNQTGWIYPQKIGNDLPGELVSEPDSVIVDDTSFYRPGMCIQIRQNNQCAYAMIMGVHRQRLFLDKRIVGNFAKNKAVVSVMEPHPININSAPPKVLFAMFKGLKVGNNWIDAKEAAILTSAILGWRKEQGGIQSLKHFAHLCGQLQQQVHQAGVTDQNGRMALSAFELQAVLSSARSISGSRRRFTAIPVPQFYDQYQTVFPPLATMTFRTQDTYTIEASAILNNKARIPVAEHTFTQIATIAPLAAMKWVIASQRDFARYMSQLPSLRVISWPQFIHYFTNFPAADPQTDNTGLSLDTVPLYPQCPSGYKQQYFAWSNTHEGVTCPGDEPRLTVLQKDKTITPGALSFWFYPQKSPGNFYAIFDFGDDEWENRICCFYDHNQLVLQLCDGTMAQSAAQIQAAINLQQKWYHVIAAWYNSNPGGLALWIDGEPQGTFSYRNQEGTQKAVLQSSLNSNSKSIPLSNTSGFPVRGVVRIGTEVIEYQGIRANSLVVRNRYRGFVYEALARGARGTAAAAHPTGATVTTFGYTDAIATPVFPGTKLAHNLAEETLSTTLNIPLKAGDTDIRVGTTKGFQNHGYLVIADVITGNMEKIRYLNLSNTRFSQCQRGALGTKAREFATGSYVFPISIMVEDNSDYPDSGIIQINDEWIEYERKIDDTLFVCNLLKNAIYQYKNTGKFHPNFRSTHNTNSSRHSFASKVIPVFRTTMGWGGRYDRVTIIANNDSSQKEEMMINWASAGYIAFSDNVKRKYKPQPGTRILKFPSGELPMQLTKRHWGRLLTTSPITPIILDELQWLQMKSSPQYFLSQAVSAQATSITVNTTHNLANDGGICKIGDEYLSYAQLASQSMEQVNRGFCGTPSSVHDTGESIFPIFFLPSSRLVAEMDSKTAVVPLAAYSDFAPAGYVKCGNEIIGYGSIGQGLIIPKNNLDVPLFRGAFGTQTTFHATNTIAYAFPVRYWDRYAPDYDGVELAYFTAAKTAPGALWQRITWEAQQTSSYNGIIVAARIDGTPAWDQPGIFHFREANAANRLDAVGDTLEIRIYFPYYRDAYTSGFWKDKAILKSIRIHYRQATRIWQHK